MLFFITGLSGSPQAVISSAPWFWTTSSSSCRPSISSLNPCRNKSSEVENKGNITLSIPTTRVSNFILCLTSTNSCCCLTTEGSTPGSSSSLSRSWLSLMVTMRAQWSHQNLSARSITSSSFASRSSTKAWMSLQRNTIWSSLSCTAWKTTSDNGNECRLNQSSMEQEIAHAFLGCVCWTTRLTCCRFNNKLFGLCLSSDFSLHLKKRMAFPLKSHLEESFWIQGRKTLPKLKLQA